MRSSVKKPCAWRTRPTPPQVAQAFGLVPALAPEPEQASHVTEVGMRICAVLPSIRFFERDLHVVAKIGAALAARGAAGAAARHAEDAFEDVCECGAEIGAEAVAAAHAAMFKSGVTEAVISGTLVAVLEDVVGLVDFLEAVLAVLIARIAVGVMLHRELAERCLQLDFRAGAFDAQDLVVVALGHAALILVPHVIMAGLNPAIHLFRRLTKERWTPGSSPGVTIFRPALRPKVTGILRLTPTSCCSYRR